MNLVIRGKACGGEVANVKHHVSVTLVFNEHFCLFKFNQVEGVRKDGMKTKCTMLNVPNFRKVGDIGLFFIISSYLYLRCLSIDFSGENKE